MENSLKTALIETNTIPFECPTCKSNVLKDALFCGNCGKPTSIEIIDKPVQELEQTNYPNQNVWKWIAPALKLWVFFISIIGLFGLTNNLLKITSPFLDLSIQAIVGVVILTTCINSQVQIKPLFTNIKCFKFMSILEFAGMLLLIYLFMFLYMRLASLIGIETIPYLTDFKKHNWPLWGAFIVICLLPGIFEEIAFRGYIFGKLEKIGSQKEALIIQAAMFSILHLLPAVFFSHFLLGLILGIVRIRSHSLYPGILLHIAWNTIVIIQEHYNFSL